MVTEDYVSFETAKLLDEKGFNIETDMYYNSEGILKIWMPNGNRSWLSNDGVKTHWCICIAPTLQSAMKWLREEKGLFIEITHESKDNFVADVYSMTEEDEHGYYKHYEPTIACCKTYEQACEAAIKHCLTEII